MKRQIQTTWLALILIIAFSCNRPEKPASTIPIEDYSNAGPEFNLNEQKAGNLFIFRSGMMGNGYQIVMFHDFSGELQKYESFYGSPELYNMATYTWKDDTTAFIILRNSDPDTECKLEVYGNANRTGIKLLE